MPRDHHSLSTVLGHIQIPVRFLTLAHHSHYAYYGYQRHCSLISDHLLLVNHSLRPFDHRSQIDYKIKMTPTCRDHQYCLIRYLLLWCAACRYPCYNVINCTCIFLSAEQVTKSSQSFHQRKFFLHEQFVRKNNCYHSDLSE